MTQLLADYQTEDAAERDRLLDRSLQRPFLLGVATVLIGVGGFVLWAFATPISSASIAPGRIVVDSRTKTVSHTTGGILNRLVVHEGDQVKAGDLLLELDSAQAKASLDQLQAVALTLTVRISRLQAELAQRDTWSYSFDQPTPGGDVVAANEKMLFDQRQKFLLDQIALQENLAGQYEAQSSGLEARIGSLREQLKLIGAERDRVEGLVTNKLGSATDLSNIRLSYERTQDDLNQAELSLVQAKQKVEQAKLTISSLRSERMKASADDLQTSQTQLSQTLAQIAAASDLIAKSEVRSPQDGIVANLRFFTEGSSIPSSQPILDIVPQQRPLLVEAHVRAADIDTVQVGQRAEIHISAFTPNVLEPLFGTVTYVEANSQVDPTTGASYYVARASIDTAKASGVTVYPGMNAEVFLVNGSKRAIDYLIEPIVRGMQRTFREQ